MDAWPLAWEERLGKRSANLTDSALITNTEVVAVGKEVPGNGRWSDVWDELLQDTTPLTTGLLRDYRAKWVRPKRRAVEPDPKPKPPVIRPSDKPVFWEAITTGGIDPTAFNQFWVEAGSMSSGGSRNQLELPRGANRFFGFDYTDYEHTEHVVEIGYPALTSRGRTWTDKPLRWHPNNRMERFNMPTIAQGGFNYQNTAVLFRRHAAGFEINVLPWNDDGAIAWRAASEALKTLFRLGEKGPRLCGLF